MSGGGLGEVKVTLGIDTSPAETKLQQFFKKIGSQKVNDPLKGMDKSFEAVAKKAEQLGFAWDKTTNQFKNDKGFASSLTQMKTNIQNVAGAAKESGTSFKKMADVIKASGTQFKLLHGNAQVAATKIREVGNEAKNTGNQLKGIGKQGSVEFNNLGKKVSGASGEFRKFNGVLKSTTTASKTTLITVTKLGQAIKNSGTKADKLSAIPAQFRNIGPAATKAGRQVQGFGAQMDQAKKKGLGFTAGIKNGFANIAKGIPSGIGMAIGNAILQPLRAVTQIIPGAIEEFRALDESIQLTLGIAGEGPQKFGALQQSILAVSSVTAATAREVADVAQSLAKAGFNFEEIDAAMQGVIAGAEATGTAYEEMAKIVVSALGAWQMAASDASKVSDILTVAANSSNQSVVELGEGLKYVGPIAYATGQSLEDVALAMELLANSGIKGSQAGTSFRTILTNLQIAASGADEEFQSLSRGSKRLAKALSLIGGDMTDANGELLKGKELLFALKEAMMGLSTGERALVSKTLAGSEGLPAMNTLISASTEEIEKLAAGLDNSMGTAAKQAKQALSGLSGSLKLLQSNISAALVQIGSIVASILKPFVDGLTAVLSVLNGLPGPIKSMMVSLALLGGVIGSVTVSLNLLKGTIVATFASNMLKSITTFAKALTLSNLQNGIAATVNGLKALKNINIASSMNAGAQSIQSLTKALSAQKAFAFFNKGIGMVKAGLLGIPATGATQLSLFATAATGAGAAGVAGSAGIAATGTASAAATPAVAGLGVTLSAFLPIILPIIGVIAALTAAYVVFSTASAKIEEATGNLAESQGMLEDSFKKQGGALSDLIPEFTSWGKSIEDTLGPIDDLLNLTGPLWWGIKAVAEGLGRLNEWHAHQQAVLATINSHRKFKNQLAKSNKSIEDNRAKMAQLNPESLEYGKLAAENTRLINGQVSATQNRINSIDETIKKLKQDEDANRGLIATLKEQRSSYQAQLPVMEANQLMIKAERQEYENASGVVHDYVLRMREATQARKDSVKEADAKTFAVELQNIEKVKKGLLSEAQARAINARAALQAVDAKIDGIKKEVAEARSQRKSMNMTQSDYEKAYATATKNLKGLIDERIAAEKAASEAVKAAVDAKISEYEREVQAVGKNIQDINSLIGEIASIGTSGISAFKTLAQEVTNFKIQSLDKAKNKELENISSAEKAQLKALDTQEKRRLASIDNSHASDAAKSAAKERVQQEYENRKDKMQQAFEKKREAAEKAYEQERMAAMREQFNFQIEAAAMNAQIKKLELDLWYEQKQLAIDMAKIENELAILRAKENGASQKEIDLLKQQGSILDHSKSILSNNYGLKGKILQIEEKIAQQQIQTAAAAEDIQIGNGNAVQSLASISSEMQNFNTQVQNSISETQRFKSKLNELPTGYKEQIEETRRLVSTGFENLGPNLQQEIEKGFQGINMGELAASEAQKMVEPFTQAAHDVGDKTATTISGYFGDAIPKELIKKELVAAFMEGSDMSMSEARKKFSNLDEILPKDQIASVFATAVGGGYQEGLATLESIPLPEGMLRGLGDQVSSDVKPAFDQLINQVKTDFGTIPGAIEKSWNLATVLSNPLNSVKDILMSLAVPPGMTADLDEIATNATEVGNSGIAKELANADRQGARPLTESTNKFTRNIKSAISLARTLARELQKASRHAGQARASRWAGGDVAGGQQYTVNEMGREMFMSRSGSLSEIRAPRFGQWVAPSSGTVIPAGIAQQIRDDKQAGRASEASSSLQGAVSSRVSAGGDNGYNSGLQGALIKELRGLGGTNGPVTNNVQITSERPVNDASKMLVELARLRAQRRR